MKSWDEYMNDPSIAHEPLPLREVHAARLAIYDETKGMTPKEVHEYYKIGFDEMQKKFNFNIAKVA